MKANGVQLRRAAFMRLCSLLMAMILLQSSSAGSAFAQTQINNQMKTGDTGTVIVSATPSPVQGIDLILSTGDQFSITMPNRASYITPVSMYVDAPGDHSIYVYQDLKCDKEELMPFAYEGMRVTAVAEQVYEKTYLTCIVYRDENYRLHAGWVHSRYLTQWYPGTVEVIGQAYTGTVYTAADPVLSWAGDYFVNTKQKYTLLNTPIRACTRFLLNYQVIGRGGAATEEVLGPRSVYVNDGSGWIMVGQFEYGIIQAVLVTVNLAKPTDVMAVAVIPSCSRPDRFTFRQSLQNVLTTSPGLPDGGSAQVQGTGGGTVFWNGTPDPGYSSANGSSVTTNSDTVIITTPAVPSVRTGNIVTYGLYEQDLRSKGSREPIEWIVLDVQDNRAFLISRYGLDCMSFCASKETATWENSSIRSWLNGPFLTSAFTREEQSGILVTEVDNSRAQGYIHYERDGGNNTQDRLFLLSYAEAWSYFYQGSDRSCRPTEVAKKRGAFESPLSGNCPWWLRSPGYMDGYVCAVDVDGNRGGNLKYGSMAVRPAMWVDISVLQRYGVIR